LRIERTETTLRSAHEHRDELIQTRGVDGFERLRGKFEFLAGAERSVSGDAILIDESVHDSTL
jgi:hypothetical protein